MRLRYFLRFSIIVKKSISNITKELDFWVNNYQVEPDINNSIKMEVGIEDCLHIEFEYNRSKCVLDLTYRTTSLHPSAFHSAPHQSNSMFRYHLKDVVIGKIYFLLVRIKVKHMEVALIKRESTGSGTRPHPTKRIRSFRAIFTMPHLTHLVGPNLYNESETLTKFEIMDGAPVRGESIPVRLFMGGFDLTPTYRNVHNKFSLKCVVATIYSLSCSTSALLRATCWGVLRTTHNAIVPSPKSRDVRG